MGSLLDLLQPDAAPVCPRCGYDLRGQLLERGTAQSGTCSECGLDFAWREVTDPTRSGPRWSIEYEPQRRRLFLAALKTWLHMLWPWGFWSRLQMHHEPRWKRIGVMYLFTLIPFLVLYVSFQTSMAVYVRANMRDVWVSNTAQAPRNIVWLQGKLASLRTQNFTDEERAVLRAQYSSQLAVQQAMAASPPTLRMSYMAAILEALFMPFARTSSGTIVWPGHTQPYPPPSWLPAYLPSNVPDLGQRIQFAILLLIPLALAELLFPLSLGLLPVSRKRAKVRWRHIWRITAYSGLTLITLVTAAAGVGAVWCFAPGVQSLLSGFSELWVVVVPAAALAIWWGCAIGRYLHIRHAWAVSILLTVLCGLVALMTSGTIVGMVT